MTRSASEVFNEHLDLSDLMSFEEDIQRNVSEQIVVLTNFGVFRGHDGVRYLADLLTKQLPKAKFVYTTRLVEGEMAFLEWTAKGANGVEVHDGVDSYVIRDGKIVAQTIHYTLSRASSVAA
jgi:hypothetical protein